MVLLDSERQQIGVGLTKGEQDVDRLRASYTPLIDHGTEDEPLMRAFDQAWNEHKQVANLDISNFNPEELFGGAEEKSFAAALAASSADLDFNLREGRKAATAGAAIFRSTRGLSIIGVVSAAISPARCSPGRWSATCRDRSAA